MPQASPEPKKKIKPPVVLDYNPNYSGLEDL